MKYYISLFSGVGGGDLAFKYLLKGFRCVGYVEFEKYCQDVIRQRQEDGLLDCAPIFGDIREFLRLGYAELYRGVAQVITAGFPCQPFSVAGKRAGADDSRNMWPETFRCVEIIRPRIFYGENVPGLLSQGNEVDETTSESIPYFGTILADLDEIGYRVQWTVLGADDVGARHRRKRLWILADSKHNGRHQTETA
jgi:DNA (cytosine-5)-methyltransferase 1